MSLDNKSIYVLFFLLALAIATLGFKSHFISLERAYLLESLSDFVKPTSPPQSLAALRTYYYAQLHTLDPLYALDGVEIEDFARAVEVTTESTGHVVDLYKGSISKETFFPRTFLVSLGETEQLRRQFLSSPNPSTARKYQKSLFDTVSTHEKTLVSLHGFLRDNKKTKVVMWNGWSDSHHAQTVLEQHLYEISALLSKAQERAVCLTHAHSCESLSHLRATYALRNTSHSHAPTLPTNVAQNRYIYEAILDDGWKHGHEIDYIDTAYSQLPLVQVTNALCTNDSLSRTYHTSWYTSYLHGIPGVNTNTLDDLFFFNFSEYTFASFFYKELEKNSGFSYAFQPTSSYLCINYGYDVQDVLSSLYIHTNLKENPIFTGATLSSDNSSISELVILEERIRQADIISTNDINAFVSHSLSLYASEGALGTHALVGEEKTKRLLHLVHVWRSKGAWFDSVLGKIDDLMQPELYVFEDFSTRIPPTALVLTRNMLPSVYQLANETVFSLEASLLQEKSGKAPVSDDIYSYNKELQHLWPTPQAVIEYATAMNRAYSNTRIDIFNLIYNNSN